MQERSDRHKDRGAMGGQMTLLDQEIHIASHDLDAHVPGKSSPTVAIGSKLRVAVADSALQDNSPSVAAQAVAALLGALGLEVSSAVAPRPEEASVLVAATNPDVVILVVHGDNHCDPNSGQSSAVYRGRRCDQAERRFDPAEADGGWEEPVRLTKACVEAGATVYAVGVGAAAAVLAACVQHGASTAVDLEDLPNLVEHLRAVGPCAPDQRVVSLRPGGAFGLYQLTPAERRVLYHLTRGRSAGEIAGLLIVSLSTVRAHVRSILRKLGVNTQLAAVAVANGTADPDQLAG